MSRRFDVSQENQLDDAIQAASQAAKRGQLVVVPTEACYGLATDAFNNAAVAKLREAKGRGPELPIPVMVPSPQTVSGVLTGVGHDAGLLMEAFWPGALTLVGKSQPSLMWEVSGTGSRDVSVRMPLHPVAWRLTDAIGPLALTAANVAGADLPTTYNQAQAGLGDDVAVYLDAGTTTGAPSTIVDISGDVPVMLREGDVTLADLLKVVPGLAVVE
ncbi:MAG: L-threonylcarbamoyladenylate synthase [Candidatus Nanopelagicales bacterium]